MLNDKCHLCEHYMSIGHWYVVEDEAFIVVVVYFCTRCSILDSEHIQVNLKEEE